MSVLEKNKVQIAVNILNVLQKHRRIRGEKDANYSIEPFIDKVLPFIEANMPFKILLSAFHCKSINSESVLGNYPDAAEEESVKYLETLCEEIKHVYLPGCELLIVHEGHFYSDIKITPTDDIIEEYENSLHRMATSSMIKFTNVMNQFSSNYAVARQLIFKKYMTDLIIVKQMVKQKPELLSKYVAYKAFTQHEFSSVLIPEEFRGRSMVKKFIKETAYLWLQRYLIFKDVCADIFKGYFPLSVLSYGAQSERFSINLIPNGTNFGTPWFNVLLKCINGSMKLIKKQVAEKMGYKLVFFNKKPWCYQEV